MAASKGCEVGTAFLLCVSEANPARAARMSERIRRKRVSIISRTQIPIPKIIAKKLSKPNFPIFRAVAIKLIKKKLQKPAFQKELRYLVMLTLQRCLARHHGIL